MTLGKEAFQINILSFKRCKYLFSFLMAYFVLLMIFSSFSLPISIICCIFAFKQNQKGIKTMNIEHFIDRIEKQMVFPRPSECILYQLQSLTRSKPP